MALRWSPSPFVFIGFGGGCDTFESFEVWESLSALLVRLSQLCNLQKVSGKSEWLLQCLGMIQRPRLADADRIVHLCKAADDATVDMPERHTVLVPQYVAPIVH